MRDVTLIVRPRALCEDTSVPYFWRIGCVGYESRARHFFSREKTTSPHSTAFTFDSQQVLQFEENKKFFASEGFDLISVPTDRDQLEAAFSSFFSEIKREADNSNQSLLRLLVDISSMTRQMISLISLNVRDLHVNIPVECDFVYSPARFGELPKVEGPILSDGPVTDRLAGWCPTPGAPCGLVLGIGYEPDLALGVIEDLEAGEVWAFRPFNSDPKYDDAIEEHNRGLEKHVPTSKIVRYFIDDPYALYVTLNQLVRSCIHEYRTIIVPFGPKIFSLCSSLVTLANYPSVGLWRVSGGPNLTPVDREPTGEIVGLLVVVKS